MIYLQQLQPQIDFGFGVTQKSVQIENAVTIWLGTLYNEEAYTFQLSVSSGTYTKMSDYEYQLYYTQRGIYTISLAVTQKATGIRLMSNTLTLTVT